MAKKRILKKEIYYLFEDLFFDLLICQHFIPNVNKSNVESILLHISEANIEFICRAHHSPNRKNKKETKQYYDKLFLDLDNTVKQISKDIEALNQ